MKCEACGRSAVYGAITRRLLDEELGFCSGRCAAVFDRLFQGTEVLTEAREQAVATPIEGMG